MFFMAVIFLSRMRILEFDIFVVMQLFTIMTIGELDDAYLNQGLDDENKCCILVRFQSSRINTFEF